ncbi:MAG: PLP-dependent aminotransferase family protein [Candidatus Thermoplasmatota archaeon]|nr:PLP-dependent aminotransferase family protein [Candidatus Thermoplasmatota archaeon]
MVVNLERLFSSKATRMKASEIREILKLTQAPGVISMAGGLPNPDAFPVEIIRQCVDRVLTEHALSALQYGTTEGLPALRSEIAKRMREKKGIDCEMHDVLVINGAQQGLSFIAFNFIDPGDTYISTAPTYLGAIQAFHAFGANCEAIPMIDENFDIDALRRNINRMTKTGVYPKFIYVVPTFQNPSGETMPLDNRKALLEVASEYDLLIVEDDPYGELLFEGDPVPTIKSLDRKGRVIYLGTFSKILAPGFRLGWTIASRDILNKFILTKQAMDLCTNVFGQYVAYEYMSQGYLDQQILKIREMYGRKRDIMLNAIKEHFPPGIKWTTPTGGLFLWVTLPRSVNTRLMLQKALEKKVAYVVGDAFYPDGSQYNSMRLNFSYCKDEELREGVKRLADVIREELEMTPDEERSIGNGV